MENKTYEALCSINIGLQRLGLHGEEVAQIVEIEQTTDMCDVSNTQRRYVRDLELFKLLKIVFRQMYTRIARRGFFLS